MLSGFARVFARPARAVLQRRRARTAAEAEAYHGARVGSAAEKLRAALARCPDPIPVLVISFENGVYVKSMCRQLRERGLLPVVLDNGSVSEGAVAALLAVETDGDGLVVRVGFNGGHMIGFEPALYRLLPEVFAYTDPDLLFNAALPVDFLSTLEAVAREFGVFKAGCALDLPTDEVVSDATHTHVITHPVGFSATFSIPEWEQQFWRQRIRHDELEVWAADIDTTFAVYIKSNYQGDFYDAVRVSGAFGALHLPWFPARALLSTEELDAYRRDNRSSTWL